MIGNVESDFGMIGNIDFNVGVLWLSTSTLECLGHQLQLWGDQAIDFDFGMISNVDFDFDL